MIEYNATAIKKRADGTTFSVEAVEVDGEGRVLRASGFRSPAEGTTEFEGKWEEYQFSEVDAIHIEEDGAKGYHERLRGPFDNKGGESVWRRGRTQPSGPRR